jgi:hypothetical protein
VATPPSLIFWRNKLINPEFSLEKASVGLPRRKKQCGQEVCAGDGQRISFILWPDLFADIAAWVL